MPKRTKPQSALSQAESILRKLRKLEGKRVEQNNKIDAEKVETLANLPGEVHAHVMLALKQEERQPESVAAED